MDKESGIDDSKQEADIKVFVNITHGEIAEDGKLFGTRKEDIACRHRFFHTACVCLSMFAMGWRNGLIGPTFPDLRLIIEEDLSRASWIFTAISLGGLIGTILGGYAYDRLNKLCVFVVVVMGMGLAAAIAPWCSHFAAMLSIHVLHGIFNIALDTAATTDAVVVWKHRAGPYMQAIHSLFSVGAIISPFVADPFLAEKISTSHGFNGTCVEDGYSLHNITLNETENIPLAVGYNNSNCSFDIGSNKDLYGPTRIYIPFLTATFVCLLASSTYFVVYFIYGNVYNKSLVSSNSTRSVNQKSHFLNKKLKVTFTLLLSITLTFYMITERCFIGFLMTFLTTELKWSKTEGSTASSIFWIAFAAGRLSGIAIVKYINISLVLVIFFSILTTGATLFLIGVIVNIKVLVWISIGVVGYGMSIIFASVFSWLSENVRRLTGKMASVLFICLSLGTMGAPVLLGYLMDNLTFMWFIYLVLILVCVVFVIYICILIVYKILERRHRVISKHENIQLK